MNSEHPNKEIKFTEEEWQACLKVLRILKNHPEENPDVDTFKGLVVKIYKDAKKRIRIEKGIEKKQEDYKKIQGTFIFKKNDETDYSSLLDSPEGDQKTERLHFHKKCYICKSSFQKLHSFYHALCPACAEINYNKRFPKVDLSGRHALLTGGRKKIGLELGLMLLRNGAEVMVTTRFPGHALLQYKKEKDYSDWKNKLHIQGLDLRNLPAVEKFIASMYDRFPALDIIINNAAQTVKRPPEFYAHLLEYEPENFLLEAQRDSISPALANPYFPEGKFDKLGQQMDLREHNSWMAKLDEVPPVEMLETQLVNHISPFMLNSGLKRLMLQSEFQRKFIVNVSAMEGNFSRENKTFYHPHTNMAKAALNMMTRTSGTDYAKDNIYMTSVDTGWITDENPFPKKQKMRERGFVTPLDIVDGAARVFDPIATGINEPERTPFFGVFLKDYQIYDW